MSDRSPNHYARQRTMVVMETVRAATMASSKKKNRLQAKQVQPLATSSPSGKNPAVKNPVDVCPPSPILLPENSSGIPEELVRYKNQTYVAPEKLQIVKPLEGSVTLLKWKLLASPQLGGATTYFSDASRPGVHMKKWKGGMMNEGTRTKSLSTADISLLDHNRTYPPYPTSHSNEHSRNSPKTVETRVMSEAGSHTSTNSSSKSFLNQVGTYLGSGWFGGSKSTATTEDHAETV